MIIKTKRNICKLVSLVTLSSFLMTSTVWAMPDGGLTIAPKLETPSFLQVEIPKELASVEEVYEAPAKENPKLVLNIQDIHGNYESQVQISRLLQYLHDKFGFKLLFAEGAAEKLNMDLLRFFPDAERNHKLADLMAKNGELTGIEYFMMDGPRDVEAVGIEKTELYRQNYEAFKKVYRSKAEVDRFLELFDGRLETLSSRVFSSNTRRLLSEWKKFEAGQRDFLPYVKRVSEDAKSILNLDLESLFAQVEWPQITRLLALQSMEVDLDRKAADRDRERLLVFLKEQKISEKIIHAVETLDEKKISMSRSEAEARREDLPRYLFERLVDEAGPKGFRFHDYPAFSLWAGHLILQNELDSKLLFEEIEKIFTKILSEVTVSEREKNLMELTRDEILLKKLFHLEVTRKEWERAVYRKDWLALNALVGRLKKISDEMNGDLKLNADDWAQLDAMSAPGSGSKQSLSGILETSYEFYEFARKRESVFFKTINDTMNERKVEKAVLVTGGFHTDGLMDMFRENEYNASILMPRINGDLDNSAYISTMLENKPSMFEIGTMQIVMRAQALGIQEALGADKTEVVARLVEEVMQAGSVSLDEAKVLVAEALGIIVATETSGGKTTLNVLTPSGDVKSEMRTSEAAPAAASTVEVNVLRAARTLAKTIYDQIYPTLPSTSSFRDVRVAIDGIRNINSSPEKINAVLARLNELQEFRKNGNLMGQLAVGSDGETVATKIERVQGELNDLRRFVAFLDKEEFKRDTIKRLTEVSDFRNNPVGAPAVEKVDFSAVIDQLSKPEPSQQIVLKALEKSLRPIIGADLRGLGDDVLKDLVLRVLSLQPTADFDPSLRVDDQTQDNKKIYGITDRIIRNETRTVATYQNRPLVNMALGDEPKMRAVVDYLRDAGALPALDESLRAVQTPTATGTGTVTVNPAIVLYAGQSNQVFHGISFPADFFTGKPAAVVQNFVRKIFEDSKVNLFYPMALTIEPSDMDDIRVTVFTPDPEEKTIAIGIDLTPNYFEHVLGDLPEIDLASGIGESGLTFERISNPRTNVQFIPHSENVGQWNILGDDGRKWTVWSGDLNDSQNRDFRIVTPAAPGAPEQSSVLPSYDARRNALARALAERTLRTELREATPKELAEPVPFRLRLETTNQIEGQFRYRVNWDNTSVPHTLTEVLAAIERARGAVVGSLELLFIEGAPYENQIFIRNGSVVTVQPRAENRNVITSPAPVSAGPRLETYPSLNNRITIPGSMRFETKDGKVVIARLSTDKEYPNQNLEMGDAWREKTAFYEVFQFEGSGIPKRVGIIKINIISDNSVSNVISQAYVFEKDRVQAADAAILEELVSAMDEVYSFHREVKGAPAQRSFKPGILLSDLRTFPNVIAGLVPAVPGFKIPRKFEIYVDEGTRYEVSVSVEDQSQTDKLRRENATLVYSISKPGFANIAQFELHLNKDRKITEIDYPGAEAIRKYPGLAGVGQIFQMIQLTDLPLSVEHPFFNRPEIRGAEAPAAPAGNRTEFRETAQSVSAEPSRVSQELTIQPAKNGKSVLIALGGLNINISELSIIIGGRPVQSESLLISSLDQEAQKLTAEDRTKIRTFPTQGLNERVRSNFESVRRTLLATPSAPILVPGVSEKRFTPLPAEKPEVPVSLGLATFNILLGEQGLSLSIAPDLVTGILAGGLMENDLRVQVLAGELARLTSQSAETVNLDGLKGTVLEPTKEAARLLTVIDMENLNPSTLEEIKKFLGLVLIPFSDTAITLVIIDSTLKRGQTAPAETLNLDPKVQEKVGDRLRILRIPKEESGRVNRIRNRMMHPRGEKPVEDNRFVEMHFVNDQSALSDLVTPTMDDHNFAMVISRTENRQTLALVQGATVHALRVATETLKQQVADLVQKAIGWGYSLFNNQAVLSLSSKLQEALNQLRVQISA